MLTTENLTITLRDSGRPLVKGLNISIPNGAHVAVIGEEGDGKSTLLKCLFDPNAVSDYCDVSGRVVLRGAAAYLSQFISESDAELPVYAYADGCDDHKLADMLGLSPELIYSDRRVKTLSGGERIKLRLFKLLSAHPDVLMLDEPTNDLDAQSYELIDKIIRNSDKTVLFVSHDTRLVTAAADCILHLEQLKKKRECLTTFATLGYADYVKSRAAMLDRQTKLALKQREDYDKQQRRWQRVYERVKHEQNTVSRSDPHGGMLLKKKMKSVQAQKRRFEKQANTMAEIPDSEDAIITFFPADVCVPSGKTVLDFKLDALKAGEKTLAKDIALKVTGAQKVAITGTNGAGKSTLLRAVRDELIKRRDIKCMYMPQDYGDVFTQGMTPLDYLSPQTQADVTRARTLLGNMRFTPAEAEQPVSLLSGGQQAKLIYLKAVLDGCNVLILDEPTRNFSPLSAPAIIAALSDFNGCIISVSHDGSYISSVCDTVYELTKNGLIKR